VNASFPNYPQLVLNVAPALPSQKQFKQQFVNKTQSVPKMARKTWTQTMIIKTESAKRNLEALSS